MTTNGKPQDMPGVFICLYGPSKAGKTVASSAAAPNGVFIGKDSGLLSARKFLGIEKLNTRSASLVPDATAQIKELLNKAKRPLPSVVIDDFSLMVEATINEYESSKGRSGMWSALTRDVLEIRDQARNLTDLGSIVIFNCHEQPPRTSSGRFIRGGPSLPGQLPEKFSGMVDVIGRTVFEATAAPWKYQLCFEPQPDYVCGDRLGVFPGMSPLNLAEGLRFAGYPIPYPPGLEWAPMVVEKLSTKILEDGIENWPLLVQRAFEALRAEHPVPHVRWAVQDALHRAILIHHQNVGITQSFSLPSTEEELFA